MQGLKVGVTGLAVLAFSLSAAGQDVDALEGRVVRLRDRIETLEKDLKERDKAIDRLSGSVADLGDRLSVHMTLLPASIFLAGPPPSSDVVGVAKAAVLAPRIEVDAAQIHDIVSLRLSRLEIDGPVVVAQLDLVAGQPSLDLPVDRSGALYLLDWETSEGHSYALVLRDGATLQAAATVQVRPLQNQGRFVYVAFGLD